MRGSPIGSSGTNTLITSAAYDIPDDILFTLGDDSDIAVLLNSLGLASATELTGVFEGTSVKPTIAANTLIISNVTNDGDIIIAASDGGNSKAAIFFDASTPDLYLYNVGGTWTSGATTWTIPAVTLGGAVAGGDQAFTGVGDMTFTAASIIAAGATNADTLLFKAGGLSGTTFITLTSGATDACELDGCTLDTAIAKGTWTASGTWTIPAHTSGAITLNTIHAIHRDVTNSNLTVRGGTTVAGKGAYIDFYGFDAAGVPGSVYLQTPNAAGNANLTRLDITGAAATAIATWALITHTGLVLSGALDCAGQFVSWTTSLDSAAVADTVSISGYEISGGHRALAISSEEVVVTAAAGASDEYLPVRINGATYKLLLHS